MALWPQEPDRRTATTIRALMRLAGVTTAGFARDLGVSRQALEACLTTGRISVGMLEQVAEALNVPPATLLLDPIDAQRWMLDNTDRQAS